jgi:futalosine hydrolase
VTGRLLVVTAVAAERDAILGPSTMDTVMDTVTGTVVAAGVGTAAAAATTARLLATAAADDEPFAAVISAGVAGGFAGRVPVGGLVLADRSVAADLGADSPDGFLSLDRLGYGPAAVDADPTLLARLRRALPNAVVGPVLTVNTVTGTAEAARELLARHPDAVAEAMEGFGVATAAAQAGVPFAEVRAISNPVGPRDRQAWRIHEALATLRTAFAGLR